MKVLATSASATAALLMVLLIGTWARSQELPAPLPVPVEQAAYPPVKALIDREQSCASDVESRRTALNQAQVKLFLTDRERDQYLAEKRRALDEATACQKDAYIQLVQVALPKLETACGEAKASTCAQWAQNQRLWRLEIQSVRKRRQGCSEDKTLAALQHQEQVVMSSSYSYKQKMQDLEIIREQKSTLLAAQQECVGLVSRRISALEAALAGRDPAVLEAVFAGRDPAAEARFRAEALARKNGTAVARNAQAHVQILALMSTAQGLAGKLGPELTFDGFRESLSQLAMQQAAIRPVPGDAGTAAALHAIRSITDKLQASENAWTRENRAEWDIERLTRERNAVQGSSEKSRLERDIAEENLKHAIDIRDRAKEDRAAAWRTVERLVSEGSRLLADTGESGRYVNSTYNISFVPPVSSVKDTSAKGIVGFKGSQSEYGAASLFLIKAVESKPHTIDMWISLFDSESGLDTLAKTMFQPIKDSNPDALLIDRSRLMAAGIKGMQMNTTFTAAGGMLVRGRVVTLPVREHNRVYTVIIACAAPHCEKWYTAAERSIQSFRALSGSGSAQAAR